MYITALNKLRWNPINLLLFYLPIFLILLFTQNNVVYSQILDQIPNKNESSIDLTTIDLNENITIKFKIPPAWSLQPVKEGILLISPPQTTIPSAIRSDLFSTGQSAGMIYLTNLDLSFENKTTLKNKFKKFFDTIVIAGNIALPTLYKKMYEKEINTNNNTNNTNNKILDIDQISDIFKTTIESTNIDQNSISNEESLIDGRKAYTYTYSLTGDNVAVSLSLTFLTVDNNLIIILYSSFPAKLYITYYISFKIVLNTIDIISAPPT